MQNLPDADRDADVMPVPSTRRNQPSFPRQTRRRALGALARGSAAVMVISMLRPAATAAAVDQATVARPAQGTSLRPRTPEPASIERAEALLADVEAIVLQLDDESRLDVADALDRVSSIAATRDPLVAAAEMPTQTGQNRAGPASERAQTRPESHEQRVKVTARTFLDRLEGLRPRQGVVDAFLLRVWKMDR